MAASYHPHTLIQFGGTLNYASGTDIWSNSIRAVAVDTFAEFEDNAGYMASIKTPLGTWFHATTTKIHNLATLDYLKVNGIDAFGHYSDAGNTNVTDYSPVVVGGVSPVAPLDTCYCFTWETGRARGLAHRGRIYPPNAYAQTAGELTSADRTAAANAGKALINLLQAGSTGGGTAQPGVFSSRSGVWFPITAVSVDSLSDVQQRRENKINGTRTTVSI